MKALDRLLQRARTALEKKTRRERVALVIMAVTVAAALWIQLLWTAHHERARYTRLVADMQLRNGAMKQTREVMLGARAQAAGVRPITAEQALAVVAEGLRAAGITGIAVLPDAQGRLRLTGTAPFDPWLGWVAKLHSGYGIHVVSAGIEPSAQAGQVKIDAVVALAGVR